MARFLTLSKAARLVGTKRGALQKKIQAGELSTFEGMLELNELLRVYPNVELESSAMIEKVQRFADDAVSKIARGSALLPDTDTLLARVSVLSQELAAAKAEVFRYADLVNQLKPRIASLDGAAAEEDEHSVRMFRAWFLHALEGRQVADSMPIRLLAKEAFLRVMAAHVRVMPSGHEFFVEGSDNLLEAGLRAGVSLPFGCNDGSCGRCKARLVSGQVRVLAESGYALSEQEQADGYLLPCSCAAVTDLVMEAGEARTADDVPVQMIEAEVRKVEISGETVIVGARINGSARLWFLAGQYVQLQFEDGSSSDCAIASCPCDERSLEFHVSGLANETFRNHAFRELEPGQAVTIRGPRGGFILDTESTRPLIFIAFDTGFGAVKSLVEHAMALENAEAMHIYRVNSGPGEPYLDNLCRSWSDALDNLGYTAVDGWSESQGAGPIVERLLNDHQHLAHFDIYVAAPESVLWDLGLQLETRAGAVNHRVFIEPVRYS